MEYFSNDIHKHDLQVQHMYIDNALNRPYLDLDPECVRLIVNK